MKQIRKTTYGYQNWINFIQRIQFKFKNQGTEKGFNSQPN
ncbi:hypothetical protein L3V67_01975 [Levilactobacillus sp. HBUAS51416]|nr:hypothetical protein [Levilactobacillus tujiorum]